MSLFLATLMIAVFTDIAFFYLVFQIFFTLDLYSEFLDDDFNARDYANTIIEGHHIGEALSKLSTGIELLNKELLSQVILTFNSLKKKYILLSYVSS